MAGRVFVTGGSGFVGREVVQALLGRGYAVNALVNRRPLDFGDGVRSIVGGLFDPAALAAGLAGSDAVIHLVGIIMEKPSAGTTFERIHHEGTQAIVAAANAAGVRRYVQMSALGSRAGAVSRYHQTKFAAEQCVRSSGLDWTILRPSLIHGPGGDFLRMEAAWARWKAAPYLFMPYFGAGLLGLGGAGRLQPVHVSDVARAFVDCLEKPATVGKVYELGGADAITWRQLHTLSATAIVGRRRAVMAIPAWYAKLVAAVAPASLLPFNRDQVVMSQEDNTCELSAFVADFGWRPQGFAATLASYAASL